jgi:hypothetical protein
MIVALLNQKGGGVGALALRQAGEWAETESTSC